MKPDERDPFVDRLLRGLEPPLPPPDLRSKTLTAARRSVAVEKDTDIWSVIWNSRRIRLMWAGAAALLLAGHVLLVPGKGSPSNRVDHALAAKNRADEHLVEMLRPVRIIDNVQPMVGLFASGGSLAELDLEGNSL
jgi:hypothetical protein